MGRAPRSWTRENVQLVKDHFVAVSASNLDQNRQDAVGKFIRDAGNEVPRSGRLRLVRDRRRQVLDRGVKAALAKWKALPESERRPGAVKVGPMGEKDAKFAAPTPPAGGLILKLHYRAFMREPDGKLRYVTGKDLWHDEKGERTEEPLESKYPGAITTPQAQPDHLWLTEAEWKSLLPAEPRKGQSFPLPVVITDRLCRWHLNPLNVYGEANPLGKKEVRSAEMTLTVTVVSSQTIRMRLDGIARLGAELPADDAGPIGYRDRWGYEPRLLGYLEYDREKNVFRRFDLLALGDHFGKLGIADSASRPGRQPLGIAFELASRDVPADRIHPGRTSTAKHYFDPNR